MHIRQGGEDGFQNSFLSFFRLTDLVWNVANVLSGLFVSVVFWWFMTTEKIELPEKLISLFDGPADIRAAYGGRGSGKTRSFATMSAVVGYCLGKRGIRGIILCARQFQNSLADSSLEEIKRAIADYPFLQNYYTIGETYIRSKDGRITYAFSGLDRNIASIKSKGRLLLCWVDEAEPVTSHAWNTLIPTLREEGEDWNTELWVTWNPLRKEAAVEKRFRDSKNARIKSVQLNWRDNPRFPDLLNRARLDDLKNRPESYDHIWEGGFLSQMEGAYFATGLAIAKEEGRISNVPADPLMTFQAFFDIGGTGAKADATAIWIAQFIGKEIRVLDYYEAQGQPLSAHINWLREKGYGHARITLPHDGATKDRVRDVSFESALQEAGFEVDIIPNQGKGAARARIEAARRLFSSIWFNEKTTEAGRDALGWYHEKRDDKRDIGLGPEHDWASHGADAFGLMCIAYEAPKIFKNRQRNFPRHDFNTSWMAG